MGSCSIQTSDFEFPLRDIEETAKRGGLLSMEIEFSRRCNYRCPYCYVPRQPDLADELSRAEIRNVIVQAEALGARKIIILGGEPTIYPHIVEMIAFIRGRGLVVEMFTNGSGISASFARTLAAQSVRVVLKMNSFDETTQDRLTGVKGSYRQIHQALRHLQQVGYPSEDLFLAVSTVISRDNHDEIVPMWRWLRDQGIAPYFEIITPQANAVDHPELYLSPLDLERLFEEIARLDRERYGHRWEPQPPLVGTKCLRHRFSCLVTARGDVLPCVGVTLSVGNIRETPLADILQNSQVIQNLKRHRETIKGPCGDCDRAAECYGCRGAAFQMTGDYLASDPLCWKNNYPAN
ncbi:MAG: radical SAM protein [Desulfobacterales bacterium]|jgi:radical SAM protein with 4Fe4S-binding SPASM domain